MRLRGETRFYSGDIWHLLCSSFLVASFLSFTHPAAGGRCFVIVHPVPSIGDVGVWYFDCQPGEMPFQRMSPLGVRYVATRYYI